MLTKGDLNQIREVIHEEVRDEVKSQLKPVKKDLRYLKKTLDTTIDMFDGNDIKMGKRVARIEDHLSLTPKN